MAHCDKRKECDAPDTNGCYSEDGAIHPCFNEAKKSAPHGVELERIVLPGDKTDKAIGGLLSIAARLVMGKCLEELGEVCENQKTVSTDKLQGIVDRVADRLKEEARYIRKQTDKIRA